MSKYKNRDLFLSTYLAPNETKFEGILEEITTFLGTEEFDYFGLIGGVDTNLNYISMLKPKNSHLFDINPLALDYAKIRLENLDEIDIISTQEEILEKLHQKVFDMNHFKKAKKRLSEYFKIMNANEYSKNMLWANNLDSTKIYCQEINLYQFDFFDDDLNNITKISKNAVIYISNTPEWLNKKGGPGIEKLISSLEKNFSHLQKGVVISSRFERNKILAKIKNV